MNGKQRIRAILRQQPHDRLGWDFPDPRYQDICFAPGPRLHRPEAEGKGAWELLETVAKKRGFLISGGEPDTERAANIVLDEFRGGKIGRMTLEFPGE